MRAGRRKIKDGTEFDYLFPKSKGQFVRIENNATLQDTLELMDRIINSTLSDTSQLATILQAETIKQTCRNIWNFVFQHFQYRHDKRGTEQVRRPARSWANRVEGVDCDCMTVFIASTLVNLGIPYTIRLTKNKPDATEFEHVYPVVKTQNETIILDAVVHKFNREAPYREKKDIDMKLEYLNGVDSLEEDEQLVEDLFSDYPMDAERLIVDGELEGLDGRLRDRWKKWRAKRAEKKKIPLKQRLKQGAKKFLNFANKLNPGAALLRLGLLASMKLNIGKVARKLRFSYWDKATAVRNNMLPNKYDDLVRVRKKLETIFYGAGGKVSNLKKAILTGKGNKDKKVQLSGLGSVIDEPDDNDDLRAILGDEIFFEEAEVVDESIDGLGAVTAAATGAAVTAAAGIIATIASLIKKVGGTFRKGSPQQRADQRMNNIDDAEEKTRRFNMQNVMNLPFLQQKQQPMITTGSRSHTPMTPAPNAASFSRSQVPDSTQSGEESESEAAQNEEKGFKAWVKKNKTAVIVGSSALALGAVGLGIWLVKRKKKKSKTVNGLDGTRKRKRKTTRRKSTRRKPARRRTTTRKRSSSRKMIELG